MDQIEAYEAIADAYRDSMRLSFREAIETHTLLATLGDVAGAAVLDMGCGDGFYTRVLKRAGAAAATGVDVSAEMIRRAAAEERRQPLGCTYRQADVGAFAPAEPVDVVVAVYLLSYSRTAEQLRRFCRACHAALRPGGRFAGLCDNVRNPSSGGGAWRKYGLERACPASPREGDPVRYTIINDDGTQFEVTNFYLAPETYQEAFRAAGFSDFRWVDVQLHPSQRGNAFWDDFLTNPPVAGFSATR